MILPGGGARPRLWLSFADVPRAPVLPLDGNRRFIAPLMQLNLVVSKAQEDIVSAPRGLISSPRRNN